MLAHTNLDLTHTPKGYLTHTAILNQHLHSTLTLTSLPAKAKARWRQGECSDTLG